MDKYETLLKAILALDPFGDKFLTIVNITESNGRHLASLGGCTQCGAEKGSHTHECPVTLLRKIIYKIQDDNRKREELDKAVSTIRNLSGILGSGAALRSGAECREAVEGHFCHEAKDCTPLNERAEELLAIGETEVTKYITSPTDNGV